MEASNRGTLSDIFVDSNNTTSYCFNYAGCTYGFVSLTMVSSVYFNSLCVFTGLYYYCSETMWGSWPGIASQQIQWFQCSMGVDSSHYCLLYGMCPLWLHTLPHHCVIDFIQKAGFMLVEIAFAQTLADKRRIVVVVGEVFKASFWCVFLRNMLMLLLVPLAFFSLASTGYHHTLL